MLRSRLWLTRFGLGMLLALMIGGSALAASNSISDIRLSPGGTICLPATYALTSADIAGSATRSTTFVISNGSTLGQLRPISSASGISFRASYTQGLPLNAKLPGYFKVCATNNSTVENTRVSLSINTN